MGLDCKLALNSTDFSESALIANGNRTIDADIQSIQTIATVAYGYIAPIIVCFGIFGDVMTIYTLSSSSLRRSSVIYLYLLLLAVTDLFTLISVIPMLLYLRNIKGCSRFAANYYAHIGFPLVNAFMGASVWIVVFLTLSQFVAVCYPFSSRLKSRKLCGYLSVFAYCLSFAIYAPNMWKKEVRYLRHVNNSNHVTTACAYISCDRKDFTETLYFLAFEWVREGISRLIPFLLLAYLNIRILISYKRASKERKTRISLTQQERIAQKSNQEEKRLLLLLTLLIGIFFVCTIPAAPLTIFVKDGMSKNTAFQVIRAIINILEFTKFALNYYFYCMINPEIRRIARERITCRSRVQRNQSMTRHTQHGGTSSQYPMRAPPSRTGSNCTNNSPMLELSRSTYCTELNGNKKIKSPRVRINDLKDNPEVVQLLSPPSYADSIELASPKSNGTVEVSEHSNDTFL